MTTRGITLKTAALAGIATLSLGLAACSDDNSADVSSATSAAGSAASEATSAAASGVSEATDAMSNDKGEDLVGPGCAAYADAHPDGPASVAELKNQNIVEAVGNVPELSTLAQALSGKLNPEVDLVPVLKDGEWTVFAPTDDAFSKLDAATVDKLKQDPELLKSILTYHVVKGQAAPADAIGTHTTVNGKDVTVKESGSDIMVNDSKVACGGIKTKNATVYLIDTVLMPN
ncbi:fasciclin domain-containing protein [Corynebacterium falsenii]|uniref:fasciclin domain-containing protein n=1 Tax=Corynebacterium falsenii TaxID=108486 RepID=UPI003FD0161B